MAAKNFEPCEVSNQRLAQKCSAATLSFSAVAVSAAFARRTTITRPRLLRTCASGCTVAGVTFTCLSHQ